MKRKAIVSIAVLGLAVLAIQKWQKDQDRLELENRIAIEIEARRMMDHGALDGPSPSELIANAPLKPISEITFPKQMASPPSAVGDLSSASEQLERDEIRRDVDSIKRQMELDRMDRDIEKQRESQKAAQRDREHFLGLDHPQ